MSIILKGSRETRALPSTPPPLLIRPTARESGSLAAGVCWLFHVSSVLRVCACAETYAIGRDRTKDQPGSCSLCTVSLPRYIAAVLEFKPLPRLSRRQLVKPLSQRTMCLATQRLALFSTRVFPSYIAVAQQQQQQQCCVDGDSGVSQLTPAHKNGAHVAHTTAVV